MDMTQAVVYEPELGLEGTIPELVDWAQRYTSDYSDPALERISELAEQFKLDDKMVRIPLLLRDERIREQKTDENELPYERMKLDYLNEGKISFSRSNYCNPGTELEIRSENDVVIISMIGADDDGTWHAEGAYSVQEFMDGNTDWLDYKIGEIFYYTKDYLEE